MKIKVYTDGASRGNPGNAAAGVVAYKDGKELFRLSKYLGVNTNNYAEYSAAILALQKLLKMGFKGARLELYADSKLLVEQASGRWKVKNENIKKLFLKLTDLLGEFQSVEFIHIPREQNVLADKLANEALDKRL